jgi:hypothetical protein
MLGGTALIGYAKVTAARVQLVQTAGQSRYDAIINYGEIQEVFHLGCIMGDVLEICFNASPSSAEINLLPSGLTIKSTF